MPRPNLIVIDEDQEEFICVSCDDRAFTSEHALIQHCENASVHKKEWCSRCEWLFVSPSARADHLVCSSRHWICHFCQKDLLDEDELETHQGKSHNFCGACGFKFQDYIQHRIKHHYACRFCQKEFDNENNLIMHRKVHAPLSLECYGCTRQFAAHSAILIHLEAGNCAGGVTKDDIDEWAFDCYQSRQYTNDWEDDYRYRCPQCDDSFSSVSALLQHVESPACSARYEGAILKLKNYLVRMVDS